MDKLVSKDDSTFDIEKIGGNILSENKFFSDLCSLMKNVEFIKFYNTYLQEWSDIQCMIFYMKLYSTIEYEYNMRFSHKITDEIMTYMIKQIMDDEKLRKFSLTLFNDFKDVSHKKTGVFRKMLNFTETKKCLSSSV